MYELKNGILLKDHKPVFALGQSYYPSYHVQKVPVPPEGDRIGELQQDLQEMAEAGFNIVRMAALGDVKREGDTVTVDFPLIDAIIRRAEEVGMATMVRLQGYGVNLSGYTDAIMLNENDEEMPFHWGWFVRNCLNHPGILKDNEDATVVSAAHFKGKPSVVSFQIYNEPAYPNDHFYDYNPHSIKAWQAWLVESGQKSAEEAAGLQPPRQRPAPGEDKSDWISWRLFHFERMNWYLNHLSDKARQGYALPETLTCHMPCPALPGAILRGEDYYRVAEKMDILGITHYYPAFGPMHDLASQVLDMAESAAATFGKHAWLIEYNARTNLTAEEWERETYSAIGSGFKCVMYYQWRADYPYADGPEPEGFGMVFNNRTKTAKFERAVRMNQLINEIGSAFACAERVRSGVSILYSEQANAWFDAEDNGAATNTRDCHERNLMYTRLIYRELRREGIGVDFARACDLAKNNLNSQLLIVPALAGLSEQEKEQIGVFAAHHTVAVYDAGSFGYRLWEQKDTVLLDTAGLLLKADIQPQFSCASPQLDVKFIAGAQDGQACTIACLINIDALERPIPAGTALSVDKAACSLPEGLIEAEWITPSERLLLAVSSDAGCCRVILPAISTGGFVFFRKGA
jgi:beta-galactosidase GanA